MHWINASLACLIACAAGLTVELLATKSAAARAFGTKGLFISDSKRGFALAPGFSKNVKTSRDFSVAINTNGYRDSEWAGKDGIPIIILGDSFVFGEPNESNQTIVAKLQEKLTGFTLYNLGVPGFGTAHVLETLKKEIQILKPAYVLYFYYQNDSRWDGVHADASEAIDGVVVSAWNSNRTHRLSTEEIIKIKNRNLNPNLLDLFEFRMTRRILYGFLKGFGSRGFETVDADHYSDETAILATEQISEMIDICKDHGADFCAVILPGANEIKLNKMEPATEYILLRLNERQVPFIRLLFEPSIPKNVSFKNDAHYVPEMCEWVASIIEKKYIKNEK